MQFRIARAARLTGAMLESGVRTALREAGIAEPNCIVCYGAGYSGNLPCLNAGCSGLDKMEQGIILQRSLGDEALQIVPMQFPQQVHLPAVARKRNHSKGRDMRVCRTRTGVISVVRNGRHDFFTPIVESDTEYRAWVYRRRILAVYEKRLTEPQNNTRFGRNRANGWTFHALSSGEIPDEVRRVAVTAVRALDLDFGAVDILGRRTAQGVDVTVLEVNSAPGVSDEHRTAIVKLVNRVKEWVRTGCPPASRERQVAENHR